MDLGTVDKIYLVFLEIVTAMLALICWNGVLHLKVHSQQ